MCAPPCRASAELAGVGLDAHLLRFAKAQAAAAVALPLGVAGAALTLRGELGVLLPWGRGFASRPTCISDRCAGREGARAPRSMSLRA
jgi:hypothetical protein